MIKVSFCAQRERGSDVQGRTPFNSAFCWTSFKQWVPLKRGWSERYTPVTYQHRVGCHTWGCASASGSPVDVCSSRARGQLRAERNQHSRGDTPDSHAQILSHYDLFIWSDFLINICKCVGRENTPSLMHLFRACPYETLDVFYINLCHEKISVLMKHLTQWNAKILFLPCTQWMKAVLSWKRPGLVGVSSVFFLESFPLLTFEVPVQ